MTEQEKIKVSSAEIIVSGTSDEPYFEIKYKEVGKNDYCIGYSSYNLEYVFGWLSEYFDIQEEGSTMTKQEAIEELKRQFVDDKEKSDEHDYISGYTISALAKEMAIKALEKQIPFIPREYEDRYYACKCGNVVMMKWDEYPVRENPKSMALPYCLCCGQRLDWSEEG